jgi:hypothetical protein
VFCCGAFFVALHGYAGSFLPTQKSAQSIPWQNVEDNKNPGDNPGYLYKYGYKTFFSSVAQPRQSVDSENLAGSRWDGAINWSEKIRIDGRTADFHFYSLV